MKTLVVAPHPDDELIGCGGLLLRRRKEGADVAWLIVTGMTATGGWSAAQVARRNEEIGQVQQQMGFAEVFNLGLAAARLDTVPMLELSRQLGAVVEAFGPDEILIPHPSDAHTDHRVVFDAMVGCTKWFRFPTVRRVMAYETVSETDFGLTPGCAFRPTVFVDISDVLEQKLAALGIYASEFGDFPFPRSVDAVRALAMTRGASCGCRAAEAFELLRQRE